MGDIVALVPQTRPRPQSEAEDARILLFTGVFRERYDDFSSLSFASSAAYCAASDAAQKLPRRSKSAACERRPARLAAAAAEARANSKTAQQPPKSAARTPKSEDISPEDPLIAAVIAKVAAQAVAAAERVKAARDKRSRDKKALKEQSAKSTGQSGGPSRGRRRA